MDIANFFRSLGNVIVDDVAKVFTVAQNAVNAFPMPDNIRTDLTQLLTDAKADVLGVESLAGTLAGQVVANGVDDVTTLLVNMANALKANNTSLSALGAAELTVLMQAWSVAKAQGDTLIAQFHAGIDPTQPAVQKANAQQGEQTNVLG
jgi:hypothetical protein